jgi:hypothetical protein
VAYADAGQLSAALDQLEALHRQGEPAELLQNPIAIREDAEAIAAERGCAACLWVAS